MRFGSVCSGIEAASVAWAPLGWKAAWLSEIEPFPSAVLAHHYPDVPNLGDMLALPGRIRLGEIEAPDILCGGTPCQAFSVAGLRRSLGDARGNLSLTFCEIADAVDERRSERGEPEAIIFWENVHGVLSTPDNAFGCFLAGLAGEDDPLEPPGGKWTNAGYVLGPQRAIAWRVLDAQYFGVAQRRRRVFVVASAREGFDPATVLFEFDGVRRDTPPSREAGEGSAGGAARSLGGGGLGTDFDCGGGLIESFAIQAGALRTNPNSGPDGVGVQEGHAYTLEARAEVQAVCVTGQGRTRWPADIAPTLNAHFGEKQGLEDQHINGGAGLFVPAVCVPGQVAHTLKAEGFDASEDGAGRGQPIVVHGTQDPCVSEHTAVAHVGVMPTMRAGGNKTGGDRPPGTGVGTADSLLTTPTMQVRRLTPQECELLQGFPEGYTKIPWRKKPADDCPDGPRYRALGNSWAIPVVRWVGQRIGSALSRGQTQPSHVEAAQTRSTPESGGQRRDRTGS